MKVHSEDVRANPNGLKEFPTKFMSNKWALSNHSQSLERLNERGGMSYFEIYCNLHGESLKSINPRFNYCAAVKDFLNELKRRDQ